MFFVISGMMNWIYTWHNPRRDAGAPELAGEMAYIFPLGTARAGRMGPRDHAPKEF